VITERALNKINAIKDAQALIYRIVSKTFKTSLVFRIHDTTM